MSERKAAAAKQPRFKQTKLTFAPVSQTAPRLSPLSGVLEQQPKKRKLSAMDYQEKVTKEKPGKDGTSSPTAEPSTSKLPQAVSSANPSTSAEDSSGSPTHQGDDSRLHIHIVEKVGDLFDAPPRSVLIHACNAIGSWGGGIAAAFRQRYPAAYITYKAHCGRSLPQHLTGTALLIAPREGTRSQHYIACLFTSKQYGKRKDSPNEILQATEPAMRDLIHQIMAEMGSGEQIGELRMCHINSGLFAVPWDNSKKVIEGIKIGDGDIPDGVAFSREIVAYSPE